MRKRITANIATMPERLPLLKKMLKSIDGQFDVVRICLNNFKEVPDFSFMKTEVMAVIPEKDLTDNGKFLFIPSGESEVYFTLDDDLLYPSNYVAVTLANLKKYFPAAVTYHGRKLKGIGLRYYRDHFAFRCLGNVDRDLLIDVAGTGVTAFDTEVLKLSALMAYCENQKMSDLVFSLEVAKLRGKIALCAHKAGWLGYLEPENTIWDQHNGKATPVQNSYADKIFTIKNNFNFRVFCL